MCETCVSTCAVGVDARPSRLHSSFLFGGDATHATHKCTNMHEDRHANAHICKHTNTCSGHCMQLVFISFCLFLAVSWRTGRWRAKKKNRIPQKMKIGFRQTRTLQNWDLIPVPLAFTWSHSRWVQLSSYTKEWREKIATARTRRLKKKSSLRVGPNRISSQLPVSDLSE